MKLGRSMKLTQTISPTYSNPGYNDCSNIICDCYVRPTAQSPLLRLLDGRTDCRKENLQLLRL